VVQVPAPSLTLKELTAQSRHAAPEPSNSPKDIAWHAQPQFPATAQPGWHAGNGTGSGMGANGWGGVYPTYSAGFNAGARAGMAPGGGGSTNPFAY